MSFESELYACDSNTTAGLTADSLQRIQREWLSLVYAGKPDSIGEARIAMAIRHERERLESRKQTYWIGGILLIVGLIVVMMLAHEFMKGLNGY